MNICVAAPIATEDLLHLLSVEGAGREKLPIGYTGAPLTAVLVNSLIASGHQVFAVTVDYNLPVDSSPVMLSGPGLQFCVVPGRQHAWRRNGSHLGRALDLFRLERNALSAAIRSAQPDLVHAHWTYEFALGALDSGLPTVVTAHDSPRKVFRHTRSLYRAMRWLMARSVARRVRHLTAVSDYMALEWERMTPLRVPVIPNPLADYVLDAPFEKTPAPTARPQLALVCNGWGPLKNVERALEAFSIFRRQRPGATMHLYGADFGQGEKAERWACRNKLSDGLVFHGGLPHRKLVVALQAHDVLVHPALEESFGVVLAEAMGLGLPVVAGAKSGAVPWVLGADSQGKAATGILVDVRSAADIAQGIEAVLDDAYEDRRVAARNHVRQKFSASAVTTSYLQIYKQVLRHPAVS